MPMWFETGELLAAEREYWFLQGMTASLNRLIAPLGVQAEVDHLDNSPKPYITVDLGAGVKVNTLMHPKGAWLVVGPHDRPPLAAWSRDTDTDDVVRIAAEKTRSHVTGGPLPSPWRWARTHDSRLTQLADALLDHGVDPADIHLPPDLTLDGTELRYRRGRTELMYLFDDDITYEVTHNSTAGWAVTLDTGQPGSRGAMDLRRAITGTHEPLPEVHDDLITTEALADLLTHQRSDASGAATPWHTLQRYAPTPRAAGAPDWTLDADAKHYNVQQDAHHAAAWLRWCGFTDATVSGKNSDRVTARHLTIHFHRAQAPASRAIIERTVGRAAVAGNRAAVISANSYTRDARKWADKADAALFTQDDSGVLRPASTTARNLMPDPGEILPAECDNPSCRTMGCMLEDELCPNERGRAWASS